MKLVAGNSNRPLAEAIASTLGTLLTRTSIRRFADSEIFIEILDNVRGEDVFLIQSTSTPTNDNLMELLVCLDALKRASARRVTAVMPYYGYARQDRKSAPRTPISAKLVANLIEASGANRVLTLDLHAGQIQGFFDIPVDNLYAAPVMVEHIKQNYNNETLMFVSPDVGGVLRARAMAKRFNADLSIVDKRREQAGQSEVMNIIGDVEGRRCIIVGRYRRFGGYPLQRGRRPQGSGREGRPRLRLARGAFGRRDGAGLVIGARIAGGDRQHSDHRSRRERGEHPRPFHRAVDGGIDPPHQLGDLRFEPLRLRRETRILGKHDHE